MFITADGSESETDLGWVVYLPALSENGSILMTYYICGEVPQ